MRVEIERALRVLTLLVLAFAAWNATRAEPNKSFELADDSELRESLGRWTAQPPPHVHLSLEASPSREERAWLRALRRAGTPVSWHGEDIPALALEVAPTADPRGGMMMWIAAPSESRIAISDAIAPIDTVTTRDGGAVLFAPATTGRISASMDEHTVTASPRESIRPRRILVLGRATWEAKFVVLALEEVGWPVDARLSVAPGVDVVQGTPTAPDTARHAAVVVLDGPSASAARAIARYVHAGGGVILGGTSAQMPSLAALAPGRTGPRVRSASVAFAEDSPRRALPFVAVVPRADAIALEAREGRVAIAARRAEAGRVVQLGYDETWRWRLGGGAESLEAHRSWWSALVSSVAYRGATPLPRDPGDDDAPLAHLVDALGAPNPSVTQRVTGGQWAPPPMVLFAIVSVLLLAELASRRLRGAP